MSGEVALAAGANLPLDGREAHVTITAASLGGVIVVAEEHGATRALDPGDGMARIVPASGGARVTVPLGSVADSVDRLRVLVWSDVPTRSLEPATAVVTLDGGPVARIEVSTGQWLRAAEVLEIYRRHGAWKVRAIASGWVAGIDAAAGAVGVPASAFKRLDALTTAPVGGGGAPPPLRPAPTISAAVGPPVLRPLIDEIVGPGERGGEANHISFSLGGHEAYVFLDAVTGDLVCVSAALPIGPQQGQLDEAAARTSGETPMGRIAFSNGRVLASASTVIDRAALDTAVLKALLGEAWAAAQDFTRRVPNWRGTRLPDDPPRELRLGVAENLGEMSSWGEIRGMLVDSAFMPLVDAPQACLAPTDGTLWLGPVRLSGAARAWSVLCERVLRADAVLDGHAWHEIADWNTVAGPMRMGVVQEVGADAPPVVVLNFNALQVDRGNPRNDLEVGLQLVDDRASEIEAGLRGLIGGTTHRNNLPWFPNRRWTGPGRDIADDILARELTNLPTGAPVPGDFLNRVRGRYTDLGRGGAGYLAHLALARAEGAAGAVPRRDWLTLASELVDLAPVQAGSDNTACASIHVRRERLRQSLNPPHATAPLRTPTPQPPPPRPRPAEPGPPVPEPTPQRRKRRWFGG